jgi:hypothetical protein
LLASARSCCALRNPAAAAPTTPIRRHTLWPIGASSTVGPQIDVSGQDRYWREHYATRPYVPAGADYADWGPAYRHGARACLSAAQPRDWHSVEAALAQQWPGCREDSRLAWEEASRAVHDAWERVGAARE